MLQPTIWHNPRCSKSRESLAFLQSNGFEPLVRLYLEEPPTVLELKTVLKQLSCSIRDVIRKQEPEYKVLNLNEDHLSDDELLLLVCKHPKLLERPIVILNNTAIIPRPIEKLQVFIK